jgi:hypothetical protein
MKGTIMRQYEVSQHEMFRRVVREVIKKELSMKVSVPPEGCLEFNLLLGKEKIGKPVIVDFDITLEHVKGSAI